MLIKTPAMKLSIALILLTVNLFIFANMIGFVPDESKSALEMRKSLSASLIYLDMHPILKPGYSFTTQLLTCNKATLV